MRMFENRVCKMIFPGSIIRITAVIFLFILCIASVHAENWHNWRGPNYNGSAEARNLPVEFDKTRNVAWVTPMPGASAATPIIWEDHVFVSSIDDQTQSLLAIAINRKTGDIRWQKELGIGYGEQRRHNKASPSPVTDGEHVYFLYGTGDLACLDFDGNVLWSRNLEEKHEHFEDQFGYGSSPLLYKGKLYIQVLQRNKPSKVNNEPKDSFLLAIDPKTGEELWKQVRPSDARQETLEAYSTPIPFEINGRSEIVIFGADYATGHDPETGKEIWRWGGYNPRKIQHWRIVPSPVTGAGKIYVAAPKGEPLFALPGGREGNLAFEDFVWQLENNTPDVCVPLFYNDKLYVFDGDRYVLTALNPENGEVIWRGEPGGRVVYRSSPTGGDGKIYLMNEQGMVVVVQADGTEYRELYRFTYDEGPCRSSIAISDNQLFIRTAQNLYCIQQQD